MYRLFDAVFDFLNSVCIPIFDTNIKISVIAIMICVAINILVLKVFVAFFKK